MPQHPRLEPLAPAGRIALRRARRAALRGSVAFVLAAGLVVAAVVGSLLGHDPIGVLPFVALLGAGWAWLLRRMPWRLWAATRDLQDGRAEVISGPAGLRQRRGIGLFAPTFLEMTLQGARYGLDRAQAAKLHDGMAVRALVAPGSRILLSLVPAPAMAASVETPDPAVDTAAAAAQGLTRRETELLRLIAAGRTDKGIARELGLEPATVRTYNSQLYAKLGVSRRTEAAARAHALGLMTNVGD